MNPSVIPKHIRTQSLQKRLVGLTSQQIINPDLANRLKDKGSTIEEFVNDREVNKLFQDLKSVDEKYIIAKVDKTGNLGKAARNKIMMKEQELNQKLKNQQMLKRNHFEQVSDPVEVRMRSDSDSEARSRLPIKAHSLQATD